MHNPNNLVQIVNRKRYSTNDSTKVASSSTTGRTVYLFRTQKGNWFFAHITIWQDERDKITPTNVDDALAFFEDAQDQYLGYSEAFPHVEIEDA